MSGMLEVVGLAAPMLVGDVLDWFADPASWEGPNGIVTRLVEHLLLTGTATAAAVLIGLPLALWLGHIGRGGLLAVNISNVGRAVPTFAVLLFLAVGPIGVVDFVGPGHGALVGGGGADQPTARRPRQGSRWRPVKTR